MNFKQLKLLYADIQDLQGKLLKLCIDNEKKKEAKDIRHLLREKLSTLEELNKAENLTKHRRILIKVFQGLVDSVEGLPPNTSYDIETTE